MRKLGLVSLFSISMAYLEAAVVVYLREIYYPQNPGVIFPLRMMSPGDFLVEIGRELATILMLLSIALLIEKGRGRRFYAFIYVFGLWDIFYYFWLKVLIQWPTGLKDPDILFLIPVPWFGPVYGPFLIALIFTLTGGYVLANQEFHPRIGGINRLSFLSGSAILFLNFIYPSLTILARAGAEGFKNMTAPAFYLPPYLAGLILLVIGLVFPLKSNKAL